MAFHGKQKPRSQILDYKTKINVYRSVSFINTFMYTKNQNAIFDQTGISLKPIYLKACLHRLCNLFEIAEQLQRSRKGFLEVAIQSPIEISRELSFERAQKTGRD